MLSFFKNLPKVFFSADFYRDLLTTGKGIGFAFLLLVTVIDMGHFGVTSATPLSLFMDEQAAFFESLPTITFKDGTISSDQSPRTFTLLKSYEEGTINIEINTQTEPLDTLSLTKKMKDEKLLVYVAKDGISFLDPADGTVDTKAANSFKDTIITHETWMQASAHVARYFLPALFLVLFAATLLGHLISCFMGAIWVIIIGPLFKVDPSIAAAMRLSAAAKVPVAIIFLALVPNMVGLVLVWFGFAAFGLVSNRKPAEPASQS